MHLSIHDRTLLRGMVAGAVALAGVSACSRSDRADAGPAAATDTTTRETVALGDSAPAGRPRERIEPNEASQEVNADTVASQADSGRIRPAEDSTEMLGQVTTTDTTASGYEPMARDTSTALAEGNTTGQRSAG